MYGFRDLIAIVFLGWWLLYSKYRLGDPDFLRGVRQLRGKYNRILSNLLQYLISFVHLVLRVFALISVSVRGVDGGFGHWILSRDGCVLGLFGLGAWALPNPIFRVNRT